MSEKIYFYKGLETNLPTADIIAGALYHCTDTKNTYIGMADGTLELYSTGTQIQLYVWGADD